MHWGIKDDSDIPQGLFGSLSHGHRDHQERHGVWWECQGEDIGRTCETAMSGLGGAWGRWREDIQVKGTV